VTQRFEFYLVIQQSGPHYAIMNSQLIDQISNFRRVAHIVARNYEASIFFEHRKCADQMLQAFSRCDLSKKQDHFVLRQEADAFAEAALFGSRYFGDAVWDDSNFTGRQSESSHCFLFCLRNSDVAGGVL